MKLQCNLGHEKNYGRTVRRCFAKHEEIIPMPNLLEIQKKSYQWFLDTGDCAKCSTMWAPSLTLPATWS